MARKAANSQKVVMASRPFALKEDLPRDGHDAEIAHEQARRNGGQHAGNMKALRHEKGSEGGDGGQGDLDQMFRCASGEQDRRAAYSLSRRRSRPRPCGPA